MYQRYTTLNVGGDGIDMDSFCSQPEVSSCKLIVLAFEALCRQDEEGLGSPAKIEFDIFVLLLSKFSPRSPINEKIQFLYACLTEQGTRPFDKNVYSKLMNYLYGGVVPNPTVDESAGVMWERLTKHNKTKKLSEKAFANLFAQLDMLNVCTIIM